MPKRYFTTVTLPEFHALLLEQTGTEDYIEAAKLALWECPACQAVQSGEHLSDEMHPVERIHSASTECVACGFNAEEDREKTEYEIENPSGQNLPRFRPYSPVEAAAYRASTT